MVVYQSKICEVEGCNNAALVNNRYCKTHQKYSGKTASQSRPKQKTGSRKREFCLRHGTLLEEDGKCATCENQRLVFKTGIAGFFERFNLFNRPFSQKARTKRLPKKHLFPLKFNRSTNRKKLKENKCPNCGFDLDKLVTIGSGGIIRCRCGEDITSRMNIISIRSEKERKIEREAQFDLNPEDEEFARRLCYLQEQENKTGEIGTVYEAEMRSIGELLCENGGSDRMKRVAYRVQSLGGSVQTLEFVWKGLCGWMP